MKNKQKNIYELRGLIEEDDTLSSCGDCLRCLVYAPHVGYRSWIFEYKGTLVALFDASNGHYDFHKPVTRVDLLIAKVTNYFAKY